MSDDYGVALMEGFFSLEAKVDALIKRMNSLKQENEQLRQKLSQSVAMRVNLQEKNQELAKQVKRIISQIKEEMV